MAKRQSDVDRGTEPRDTDPSMGADDPIEQLRGTGDDDSDDIDDDELEDEDESDEGTF
jgi:hypothetical protein